MGGGGGGWRNGPYTVGPWASAWEEFEETEAQIFFADEAHFPADAELRGKWTLKGEPALAGATSPKYREGARYYSAICQETGEVEWLELEGNSKAATSVTCLKQRVGPGKKPWVTWPWGAEQQWTNGSASS